MNEVSLEEAARTLQQLVERAARGESVTILSVTGQVVRLVPVEPPHGQPLFGRAKGLIEMSPDFDEPLEDLREYEA